MPLLSESEVQAKLAGLKEWKLNPKRELSRKFKFPDFSKAVLFVNAVALLAESADHHPDILIEYNQVTLSLSTHSEGGITLKDFDLAQKIESLPLVAN